MAPNLTTGTFKIVSFIEDNPPASVNHTRPAAQRVILNGPVTTWVVRKAPGEDIYQFSVGGYSFTGVIDDRVTATIHPDQNVEWIATYREFQDAYTISPVNDASKGWTVADPSNAESEIQTSLIISTHSLPPQFLSTQLFRFERIFE